MTVVNPKSISGINSITMASGSDNLLTIHTTNTTERVRVNSDGDVIVGSGITVSPDGDIFAVGVCTATSFVGDITGSATRLTLTNQASDTECFPIFSQAATNNQLTHTNTNLKFNSSTGALTATSFVGGLPITSGADNRIITASSSSAIQGEANLTYDGDNLSQSIDAAAEGIRITGSGAHYGEISIDSNRTGANQHVGTIKGSWNGTQIARIAFNTGTDTTNKDDGRILFDTSESGGTLSTRLRITETGDIKIGDQTTASGTLRYLDVQNSDSSSASSGAILRLISSNQAQNSTTSVDLAKYRDGAFYINNNETHSSATTVFNIGGNEIARFTSDGLKFPNTKGIDFSATGDSGGMTSELLDDYEEGTWTPALQFDTGTPSITYGTRSGTYTKIGRMVHLQYYMVVSSGADVNDYFARLTLPYTGIGVGHQDARVRQWNTAHSDWFLSLAGSAPVFFMSNAMGSGVNYARGDDVNGHVLSGQYTLYVS